VEQFDVRNGRSKRGHKGWICAFEDGRVDRVDKTVQGDSVEFSGESANGVVSPQADVVQYAVDGRS
jgi:hypothetical protein